MIRVEQSITARSLEALERGEEPGDCVAAALASIFEYPLEDVPHFCDTGPLRPRNRTVWAYAMLGWCMERGAFMCHYELNGSPPFPMPGYSLLSGVSPRDDGSGRLRHTVVGWNGDIAWDPFPGGLGMALATVDEAELLYPLTPEARAVLSKPPDEAP